MTKQQEHREKIREKRSKKYEDITSSITINAGERIAGGQKCWAAYFHTRYPVPTYRHRADPVPGINHSQYTRSRRYRSANIKRLLRLRTKSVYQEIEVEFPEPKHKTSFEDYWYNDAERYTTKNWKAYRKTQWK